MSLNKEFTAAMNDKVKALVENSSYNTGTNHATFDASKVDMPEGITQESLKEHVGFINELTAQTEVATAQIARDQFAKNDKLTTVDGTLAFDSFTINSQHHLKQQIGDEALYGLSTTAVDYVHTQEQTLWLEDQRQANVSLASKLFG